MSFLHLFPELDDMVENWRRVITAKFVQAVKADITRIRRYAGELDDGNALGQNENGSQSVNDSEEANPDCVKLACTVYSCIDCEEDLRRLDDSYLWFPHVLGHPCLTEPTEDRSLELELGSWQLRKKWSCEMIKVDEDASTAAEAIVEAFGMNSKVATPDDMDKLDARMECLECLIPEVEDPSRIVFDWRSAVRTIRFVSLIAYYY